MSDSTEPNTQQPEPEEPNHMPVKRCCKALEVAYDAGMVIFAHTPYLSKDINMIWINQTNSTDSQKTVNHRCIWCSERIEMEVRK